MTAPRGAFLVARHDGGPVGCGAVKLERGVGVGRRLLVAPEKEGAGLGIGLLRLETNRSLHEAHALYP